MAVFAPGLGADEDYQRGSLVGMYFRPLSSKLFLGLRGQYTATFGDPPFFVQPYVALRGAPAMRYQGEEVAQAEAELRWQFWKRFSMVGFAGTGKASSDIRGIERDHHRGRRGSLPEGVEASPVKRVALVRLVASTGFFLPQAFRLIRFHRCAPELVDQESAGGEGVITEHLRA